eukprot:9485680-Pyramimonas_sp.AAC.1
MPGRPHGPKMVPRRPQTGKKMSRGDLMRHRGPCRIQMQRRNGLGGESKMAQDVSDALETRRGGPRATPRWPEHSQSTTP